MEVLFMVFMIFVSVMALFSVLVVLRDIVKDILASKKVKNEVAAQPQPEVQPTCVAAASEPVAAPVAEKVQLASVATPVAEKAPVVEEAKEEPAPIVEEIKEEPAPIVEEIKEEPAPIVEEAKEEPAPIVEEAPVEDGNNVKFAATQQTLEEKYLSLEPAAKGWYDEIIRYAMGIEGSKRVKNVRYEEYKVGNSRLVRLLIKRGMIYCDVYLNNSNFRNYVAENKIAIKQSATTIRVENEVTVQAVKNAIDIVVVAIAEEKEYKKQIMREKRRAARAAQAAAEAEVASTENAAE